MFDLIVIGGGAVGTAAGIYAARRKLDFKIIAKEFGGEVALSGEVDNYPGIPKIDGFELSRIFLSHLKNYGVEPELDIWVTKVAKDGNKFIVEFTKDGVAGQYATKAVLVGTGSHPRELNMPGEKEYRSRGVSYCTVCDGPIFKDKTVVIIGGGNSANESGIMMSGIAKEVYVMTKNPNMKGDSVLIDKLKSLPNAHIVYNAQTKKIDGDGKTVTGVVYADEKGESHSIVAQGVFIHIGMIPNSSFIDASVKDEFGSIKINSFCETAISGLFAAGDVTDCPYRQISIAIGHATLGTLRAIDYINRWNEK
ncbi:MAG: FAD-dependent oxidoreductase [Parcubacteria group bacterium]|nr:FAD-dependent oxidoreductase [Parcubacteria group bacterium]